MSRVFLPVILASVFLLAGAFFWIEFTATDKRSAVEETKMALSQLGPMRAITPPRLLPGFRFIDGFGAELTLADFRGKTLLINMWATWCAPCREEMPSLDRLQAKLGGDDFQVLAISTDLNGISVIQDFFQKIGISSLDAYIDLDGETETALKVPGLPTTLLVDSAGNAIAVKVGPMQWDSEEVVAVVNAQISPPVEQDK